MSKVILSLCDHSGNWPQFYTPEDGYEVIKVDLKAGHDVRLYRYLNRPVHGILAAPPCTDFSGSGAQYWKTKDERGDTITSLGIADACLRMVAIYKPAWWALENPVGRLRYWLGPPRFSFHPHEFAGWNCERERERDRYTKKTLLWGEFNPPEKRSVEPIKACASGSWLMKLGGKSERTKELRSITPLGFAKAFRAANP